MERWRLFFDAAGVDLWKICELALAIAYRDDPQDFAAKRDSFAQKLFAPEKLDFRLCELDAPKPIGNREGANSKSVIEDGVGSVVECRHAASATYDEAEALTEELEEEILSRRDVLDMKEALRDPYQSEREIFNALRRLELMHLSFDVLKETEIGKVVNSLRKHSSKRVATLAKRLVRDWKELVHACCRSAVDVAAAATAELADATASASVVVNEEEYGLPSPPMDEAALLGAPTSAVEMFQFWDLMDDVTSATGSVYSESPPEDNAQFKREPDSQIEIREEQRIAKELNTTVTANGPNVKDSLKRRHNGAQRSLDKESVVPKPSNHGVLERRIEAGTHQTMSTLKPAVNSSFSNEKIEAAKRNLRENHEREEYAKRQRTIQLLDLDDLPKGGPGRAKNSHLMMHGRARSQFGARVMSCR